MSEPGDRGRRARRRARSSLGCAPRSTSSTGGSCLFNERAELARSVGHEKASIGRRAIRDRDREREVLLRVSIANEGPMPRPTSSGSTAGSSPRLGRSRRLSGLALRETMTNHRSRPARDAASGHLADHPIRAGADRAPAPRPPRQRDLRLGPRPPPRVAVCCCASRTTIGNAAARNSRRRSWTISTGSGWSRTSRRPTSCEPADRLTGRATTTRSTRAHSTRFGRRASPMPVTARDRRSMPGARPTAERGRARAARAAAASEACRSSERSLSRGRAGWCSESRSARARKRGRTCFAAHRPRPSRPPATWQSATGTGTGPTRCAWWSTICATASTSSSAARISSRRRPTRSASGACSAARRHQPSPTTRSSGAPDGSKLSKADGATGIGELLDAGHSAEQLFGEAAFDVGLVGEARPTSFEDVIGLVS